MIMLRLRKNSLAFGMALMCGFAGSLVSAQGSAGIIFQDDFESCGLTKTQNGFTWLSGRRTTVNTANPKNGSCALELAYQASPSGSDSFAEQRFYFVVLALLDAIRRTELHNCLRAAAEN